MPTAFSGVSQILVTAILETPLSWIVFFLFAGYFVKQMKKRSR